MASSWQERYEELKKKKKVEDMLGGTSDIAPIKSTIRTSPKKSTKTKKTSTIKNTIPNARNPQFLINKNNSKKTSTNTGKYNTLAGTPSETTKIRNSMSLNNSDPFKTRTSNAPYFASSKKKKSSWFKSGALSDGYQFGDITKNILGTVGDAGIGIGKGVFGLAEGLVDAGRYGVSGVADFFGADEYAKDVKERAKQNTTEDIFGGIEKKVDKYSILGDRADNITQGLGYVAGILGTGGLGASAGLGAAGTTVLTTGVTGLSGMGGGMSEAYTGGATDDEALKYGLIAGVTEAGTELLFGGLGKGVKALGLSKGLTSIDDALAKKVSSKFSSHLAKNLTQYTVKAGAEGLEEVIAGVTQGIGKKLTYMSEEDLGKILEDEKLLDQFISGAVTSGIAQAPGLVKTTKSGRDFVTNYTDNEQKVVDSLVEEQSNEKAKQKAIENTINEAIKTRETEQKGILSAKEKTALTEGIKAKIEAGEIDVSNNKLSNKEISKIREEVEESLQKGTLDTNKIDSILGNTITEQDGLLAKSYQETAKKSEVFAYDSKKITDEQEKSVYDSATKYFNNTTRSHEFVEKVAKISKEKGTNYGFINNEELQSLGHDVEGKQVNGLVRTTQDGKQTVLINVDSPKALNTIVGHETTHLLEGTQEYKDLQEAIFNYAKEKGDFDSRQKALNSLYEGIDNANVDSELTADLVGDYLFTDEKFINSLSTQKPTVFQKIKTLIDDLVIKFKGTKEEKALREVQKKFKEAYKQNAAINENVASKETTDVQYSINDNQGRTLTKEQQEYFKDSKVRDENGNLIEVYHGTDSDFNEFNHKYIGEDNKDGFGFYFTPNKLKFEYDYPKTTYLNITNPATTDELINSIIKREYELFETIKDKKEILLQIQKEFGVDGIIDKSRNNIVAFNSNQIKNVDNTNPTSNADIRYSLSEKGTLQDSEGNEVKLETSDAGTHGTLMVIHNLNADKLKGIIELGGFPVPSIAITNPNLINHSSFGDISVLFDKSTIDPTDRRNEVFDRDVWSPTFPTIEYEINTKVLNKVRNIVGGYGNEYLSHANSKLNNIEDSINNRGYEEFINELKNNKDFKYVYYKNLNPNFEVLAKTTSEDISTRYSNETLREFINIYNKEIPDWGSISDEQRSEIVEKFKDMWIPRLEARRDNVIAEEKAKENPRMFIIGIAESSVENNLEWLDSLGGQDKLIENLNEIQRTNGTKEVKDYDSTNKYINENINQKDYENWLKNIFNGIVGKKGIYNGKDYMTPSGNRRTFNQLHEDYNLANLVKVLTKKDTVGGQSGFGAGQNFGTLQAKMSNKFNSIEEIKQAEERLQFNEDTKELVDGYSERIYGYMSDLREYSYNKSTDYYYGDNAGYALNDFAEYKTQNVTNLKNALENNGINSKEVPAELLESIVKDINELKYIPTDYFEAKPQRAVGLDEVQVIVIPNTTDAEFKQQLQDSGLNYYEYDPNIEGDRQRVINQFDDLKFSLSQQGEQTAPIGDYNVYGEDVKLQETIAPLQEEIKTLTESVQELKEQLAPVKEEVKEVKYTQPTKAELDNLMALQETGGTEYANTFFKLRDKYGQPNLYKGINQYKKAPDTYEAPIKGDEFAPIPQNIVEQQGQEAFNNIDESSIPSEVEDTTPDTETEITSSKSLFETRNYEDVGNRKVNAYQYDNPEVKPYFQEEAQSMLGDLERSIKGKREYNDYLYYESGGEQGFYGTERQTTNDIAELLDGLDGKYKLSYEDIRKGLNAIINDEGAENNAASKRIEFYLDQRLRNGYTTVDGVEVPANSEYLNTLRGKEFDNFYNSLPINEDMIPYDDSNSDILAPIKEQNAQKTQKTVQKLEKSTPRTTEASIPEPINKAYQLTLDGKAEKIVDNSSYNEIAEVLTNEPKTENDRNKRKWAIFKANVLDKGAVFEDLSLKNKNRDLMGKWDYTLTSEARGQNAIGQGHYGYDPDTKTTKQLSKSLNDIRAEVENTGLTKEFYEYVYHKHNVDRMTLDKRFGMEN